MIDVAAVDLVRKLATLTDGREIPIVNVFDLHGSETRDLDDMAAIIALLDEAEIIVRFGNFDRRALH